MRSIWAVHYSESPHFELKPIRVRNYELAHEGFHNPSKPVGALWTSPVGGEYGWEEWNKDEDVRDLGRMHKILLHVSLERAVVIDSLSDLKMLPWRRLLPNTSRLYPDFEEVVRSGCEAIYLTAKGQAETQFSGIFCGQDLYGWDCESLAILSEKAILEVTRRAEQHG